MTDCNCNRGCDHGCGVVPGPCISRNCGKPKVDLRIKTEVIPASAGTDEKGQPYAPKLGRFFNTIVQYAANDAVYFYDTKGIYTLMNSPLDSEDFSAEIEALQAEDQRLNQAIVDTATMLQTNINIEVNARESDRDNLQTNINVLADHIAEKQDKLESGANIKTINGESILGAGNLAIVGGGAGGDDPRLTDTGATRANNLPIYVVGNDQGNSERTARFISDGENISLDLYARDLSQPSRVVALTTDTGYELKPATTMLPGLMSSDDKAKLDSLSASSTLVSVPVATYTADNVNMAFGSDTVELTPAVGTAGGAVSKAGIMSAFQASQLAALAQAYEAEETGTVLYEGSASVNNIELSESALNYDHLIVVAQYMGMGSFALTQQVSAVFYPTDSVKAFQMNATDITTGNTPTVELIQDIWSITDEGDEIELASALKATVNSDTSVEPDTTSHFTITKVVGFGKKSVIQ